MTPEQRQNIGLDCICCDNPFNDGLETGEPRACKDCYDEIVNACPHCDGIGIAYCGFCESTEENDYACTYEGKICPMCSGENVVTCCCSDGIKYEATHPA